MHFLQKMCCSAKWGWKYVLIKPHRLRHKETYVLNQVMGFEQKFKSLNGVNNVNIWENGNGWKQIEWQLNEKRKALLKMQKC